MIPPQSPPCDAVALVAEHRHQRVERGGDPRHAPAALARLAAEPEPGQRGHDEVELLAQRPEQPVELVDRAGPAVDQQQREGVGGAPAHVPEVQVDAVDLAQEPGDRVELGLARAPVVAVAPVLAELADGVDLRAVVPLRAGDRLGPARARQALAQVGQDGVGDIDAEGAGVSHRPHHSVRGSRRRRRCPPRPAGGPPRRRSPSDRDRARRLRRRRRPGPDRRRGGGRP